MDDKLLAVCYISTFWYVLFSSDLQRKPEFFLITCFQHMPQNRVSLSKVATCCALLQLLYLLTKSCLSTVPYKWISSSTGNIFYPHNIRHFNTLLMVSASLLCGNNQSMIILPYSDIITLFCNLNITSADSTCKLSMTACSWCFLNKSKII